MNSYVCSECQMIMTQKLGFLSSQADFLTVGMLRLLWLGNSEGFARQVSCFVFKVYPEQQPNPKQFMQDNCLSCHTSSEYILWHANLTWQTFCYFFSQPHQILLCCTMSSLHVISISLISDGDHPCAHYFL